MMRTRGFGLPFALASAIVFKCPTVHAGSRIRCVISAITSLGDVIVNSAGTLVQRHIGRNEIGL